MDGCGPGPGPTVTQRSPPRPQALHRTAWSPQRVFPVRRHSEAAGPSPGQQLPPRPWETRSAGPALWSRQPLGHNGEAQ